MFFFSACLKMGFVKRYDPGRHVMLNVIPPGSPNGKYVAYWSDASGEYELYLDEADKETTPKKDHELWSRFTGTGHSGRPIARRSRLLIKPCK